MPFVNPLVGITTNSVPLMSASLASFAVGVPEEVRTALATAIVSGEIALSSYGSALVATETARAAYASLDAGEAQSAAGSGSVDAGRAEVAAGLGELEASGRGVYSAPGTIEVGDSGASGLSQRRYGATLTSVDVGGNPLAPTLASIVLRSEIVRAALASLTQRQDRTIAVLGGVDVTLTGAQEASLAALDIGTIREGEALGSVDVTRAEGIDIVVDVIDETVAGARGDVC